MRAAICISILFLLSFCTIAQDHATPRLCDEVKEKAAIMPIYKTATCQGITDLNRQRVCAEEELKLHVNKKLEVPSSLQKTLTINTFLTIDETGMLNDIEIQKTTNEEVFKNAKQFLKQLRFIPAQDNDAAKCVRIPLPLTFDINNKPKEQVFKVVDEMPTFPGCENEEDARVKRKCAQDQMNQFLYQNIEYPKEALDNKTEGMVVIRAVVDSQGNISNTKILRDIGHGCGTEAMRVVGMMPNWNPGLRQGKAVSVAVNIPISFKSK